MLNIVSLLSENNDLCTELVNILLDNEDMIPPILFNKVFDALSMVRRNVNEGRVISRLRLLILSLTNPMVVPNEAIDSYLESEETQLSATRQFFEEAEEAEAATLRANQTNSVARFIQA